MGGLMLMAFRLYMMKDQSTAFYLANSTLVVFSQPFFGHCHEVIGIKNLEGCLHHMT